MDPAIGPSIGTHLGTKPANPTLRFTRLLGITLSCGTKQKWNSGLAHGRLALDCGRICETHITQGVEVTFLKGSTKMQFVEPYLTFF